MRLNDRNFGNCSNKRYTLYYCNFETKAGDSVAIFVSERLKCQKMFQITKKNQKAAKMSG